MSNLRKLLGRRIKELRTEKNIKQHELAEILNIEARSVSRLELGYHFPKEENLEKIARTLDVEVKDLFNFSHLKSDEGLKKDLKLSIEKLSGEKLKTAYKMINSLIH